MLDFLNIAKALSDENRVRALMMLCNGELCVCQIIELLGLAPSTVSKHMSILRQARLVEARKEGKWMYYRLPDEDSPKAVTQALEWVKNSLAGDKWVGIDAKQVEQVCKMDKKQLCVHYKKPRLKDDCLAIQNRI
ncbi:MAG: ArsR/SmtB family transcription factor [Planctomycetota bacterium]|jgi:DNA-binding transcriptional ArsR family regulator